MTILIAETSQHKAARIAGLMYLIIILTSMLAMIIGPFRLIVEGDLVATFNNIKANELLFRMGAAYDLIMFASVVILSLALYVTLKPVNKNLAMLALLWRLVEAILGCLMVLCSLIVLILLNSQDYSSILETEQLQAMVGLFLDVSSAVLSIVFVFLSLGSIIFYYLFFKSKYIPKILSAFGIISFSVMLIGTFVNILLPNDLMMIQSTPAILFEVIIGLWLLIKGVNVEQRNEGAYGN